MTNEQAALIRKAQDSFRAAQLLRDEGLYDFAISRAYYAMFYVAEAFLCTQNLSFANEDALIHAFSQYVTQAKTLPPDLHAALLGAQHLRIKSDYQTDTALDRADAARQLADAERFLRLSLELW